MNQKRLKSLNKKRQLRLRKQKGLLLLPRFLLLVRSVNGQKKSSAPQSAQTNLFQQAEEQNLAREADILSNDQASSGCEEDPKAKSIADFLFQPSRAWVTYEWFYSTIDRDYFNENEYKGCLQILDCDHIKLLTRTEWSILRGVMGSKIGRPRRFSRAFLSGESVKLNDYRRKSRRIQSDVEVPDPRDFPYQVFAPIGVGDIVTAYSSYTKLIHRGQVLTMNTFTSDDATYRVQFASSYLGSQLFSDLHLAVHGAPNIILCRRRPGDSEDMNELDDLLEDEIMNLGCRSLDDDLDELSPFLPLLKGLLEPTSRFVSRATNFDLMELEGADLEPVQEIKGPPIGLPNLQTQAMIVLQHLLGRKAQLLEAIRACHRVVVEVDRTLYSTSTSNGGGSNSESQGVVPSTKRMSETGTDESLEAVTTYTPSLSGEAAQPTIPSVQDYTASFRSQYSWLTQNLRQTNTAIQRAYSVLQDTLVSSAISAHSSQSQDCAPLGHGHSESMPMESVGEEDRDTITPPTITPNVTNTADTATTSTSSNKQEQLAQMTEQLMCRWPAYLDAAKALIKVTDTMKSADDSLTSSTSDVVLKMEANLTQTTSTTSTSSSSTTQQSFRDMISACVAVLMLIKHENSTRKDSKWSELAFDTLPHFLPWLTEDSVAKVKIISLLKLFV